MRKLLCTFLMALLTLTVFAQDDNIRRPHRRPVKQQQQVTSGSGHPSKPSKPTMATKPIVQPSESDTPSKVTTQPSEPINPSKLVTPPTEQTTPSKPVTPSAEPTILTKPITQSLEETPTSKPTLEPTPPSKPVTSKHTTGSVNGYEWVDLGLSVKWATKNVGADSPSDYGGYYAWGETSTKKHYYWYNCFDCLDSTGENWGSYKKGGLTRLSPSSGHDTARENWGGTWRMPTDTEIVELCDRCKWTWTSQGGHNGYKVTGPNGNSIFLPAAGYQDGMSRNDVGKHGRYWSSTHSSSYSKYACGLRFHSSSYPTNYINRSFGQCVRPVTE